MENTGQWVGIDISKATLDVYLRPLGKTFQVANKETAISGLIEELQTYSTCKFSIDSLKYWKQDKA